jgi:hypothetical protein
MNPPKLQQNTRRRKERKWLRRIRNGAAAEKRKEILGINGKKYSLK